MTGSMRNSSAPTQTSTPTLPSSAIESEDYEATTNESSSSLHKAPSTQIPKRAPSSRAEPSFSIRFEERVFVVGMTRSGKSTLTKKLFLSTPAPRLVVDPNDSSLTASVVSPGGTFSDPRRVPDVATARFVPTDPDDRDAYDALFERAFRRYPNYYVWVDEAGQVAPASGYPKALNRYVVQGAKRSLGFIGCHTRPREVLRNLISQSSHLFVFYLPNPDDRRHIAEIAGVPADDLSAAIDDLEEKGFLWWNGNTRQLTACPPLKGI